MALCQCADRPQCEWDWCSSSADRSVFQPRWGARPARFKFMCADHFDIYQDAMTKPLKGMTRPDNDEDWRPSLAEMVRHGDQAVAFENRNRHPAPTASGGRHTPAQLLQLSVLREHMRKNTVKAGDSK